jgi:hypothetical protein
MIVDLVDWNWEGLVMDERIGCVEKDMRLRRRRILYTKRERPHDNDPADGYPSFVPLKQVTLN